MCHCLRSCQSSDQTPGIKCSKPQMENKTGCVTMHCIKKEEMSRICCLTVHGLATFIVKIALALHESPKEVKTMKWEFWIQGEVCRVCGEGTWWRRLGNLNVGLIGAESDGQPLIYLWLCPGLTPRNWAFFIDCVIEGLSVSMLVDTGARRTTISESTHKQLTLWIKASSNRRNEAATVETGTFNYFMLSTDTCGFYQ